MSEHKAREAREKNEENEYSIRWVFYSVIIIVFIFCAWIGGSYGWSQSILNQAVLKGEATSTNQNRYVSTGVVVSHGDDDAVPADDGASD